MCVSVCVCVCLFVLSITELIKRGKETHTNMCVQLKVYIVHYKQREIKASAKMIYAMMINKCGAPHDCMQVCTTTFTPAKDIKITDLEVL